MVLAGLVWAYEQDAIEKQLVDASHESLHYRTRLHAKTMKLYMASYADLLLIR